MPWRLTRPWVGRRPTVPQKCAGMRTDPPVSVPSEAKHLPGGNGGGRGARRPAGYPRRIPGVPAIAIVVVVAGRPGGEFRGAERTDFDRPGGVQLREDGRRPMPGMRSLSRMLPAVVIAAVPVEQVFVGHRDAVQRTPGFAARPALVRRFAAAARAPSRSRVRKVFRIGCWRSIRSRQAVDQFAG